MAGWDCVEALVAAGASAWLGVVLQPVKRRLAAREARAMQLKVDTLRAMRTRFTALF